MRSKQLHRLSVLTLVCGLIFSVSSNQAVAKKPKPAPRGVPVLWRAPTNIRSRDLFLGPGGTTMKPDLQDIKFLEDEKGGYSTKFRIRDGSGREWVAKVGKEAQAETAAVRLLWAAGYETEVNYLVPRLTIPGRGTFEDVRLEARPKSEKRAGEWKWTQNPFTGKREFQGLKVMMLLLGNWDIKDSNNEIVSVKETNRLRYIISDLGATFGKTGSLPLFWRITRSRNNPEDYEKARFIEGVRSNHVVNFRYGGKKREIFENITVAQARWIGSLLSQLTQEQIRDAFRAGNYSEEDISLLTEGVRDRIAQLRSLSGNRSRR
jgi:hypothetical protein